MTRHLALTAGIAVLAVGAAGVAGCGSGSSSSGSSGSSGSSSSSSQTPSPNAPEHSPSGDIPDNQAYVAYRAPGGYTVKVPEGWSQITRGGAITFTDKLNAIRLESAPASAPLTAAGARQSDVPQLSKSVKGFSAAKITTVNRPAGKAVRIAYLADAKPNAVTGKAGTDAVERYVFFHGGKRAILTLSGPKGADNVDPWKIVTSSVRWSG